jgi:DUF4097 and DUF4098 domain-containing protein YvlB
MPHFETPQPISVELELHVANVRVTASKRADTIVRVQPSQSAKRDDVIAAEQTRVEYTDGKLLVKGSRRLRRWSPFGGGSIDVEIELPGGSHLSGDTVAGEFRSTGSLGRCELKTGLGDITLERVAGDAELATGTGEVRADEIDGSAVIRNSNGDTQIREVGGNLKVKAANGHIEVDHSHGSVNARTANGSIRVGNIHRGSLIAKTAAGRIEVGIADGAAARLDVHTRHGHVHNDLDATENLGSGDDDWIEIRATTGWGDITIRRAA